LVFWSPFLGDGFEQLADAHRSLSYSRLLTAKIDSPDELSLFQFRKPLRKNTAITVLTTQRGSNAKESAPSQQLNCHALRGRFGHFEGKGK